MSEEPSVGEPLTGTGLDDRGLVRVGDTVRRPAGPWTASVHHLLRSLRASGFDLAPVPMDPDPDNPGRDSQGREVLTFLPGHDHAWPFGPEITTEAAAEALGRLAARLRNALAAYACPAGAVWQFGGPPAPGEAIQHGDLGPWNLLFSEDGPAGVIDWDFAGPGDPWYDTGHLAWFTVPLMDDARAAARGFPAPPDRRTRLAAFARGTGITPRELLRIGLRAQQEYAYRVESRGGPWERFRSLGFHRYAYADHEWTKAHPPVLDQ